MLEVGKLVLIDGRWFNVVEFHNEENVLFVDDDHGEGFEFKITDVEQVDEPVATFWNTYGIRN